MNYCIEEEEEEEENENDVENDDAKENDDDADIIISNIIKERMELRKQKQWSKADQLKLILESKYNVEIILDDHNYKTTWRRYKTIEEEKEPNKVVVWSLIHDNHSNDDGVSNCKVSNNSNDDDDDQNNNNNNNCNNNITTSTTTCTTINDRNNADFYYPIIESNENNKNRNNNKNHLILLTVDTPYYRCRLQETIDHIKLLSFDNSICNLSISTIDMLNLDDVDHYPSIGRKRIVYEGWKQIVLPELLLKQQQRQQQQQQQVEDDHKNHPKTTISSSLSSESHQQKQNSEEKQEEEEEEGPNNPRSSTPSSNNNNNNNDFVLIAEDDIRFSSSTTPQQVYDICATCFDSNPDIHILSLGHHAYYNTQQPSTKRKQQQKRRRHHRPKQHQKEQQQQQQQELDDARKKGDDKEEREDDEIRRSTSSSPSISSSSSSSTSSPLLEHLQNGGKIHGCTLLAVRLTTRSPIRKKSVNSYDTLDDVDDDDDQKRDVDVDDDKSKSKTTTTTTTTTTSVIQNILNVLTKIPNRKRTHYDQFLFHSNLHDIQIAISDPPLVGWATVEQTLTSVGSGYRRYGGGRLGQLPTLPAYINNKNNSNNIEGGNNNDVISNSNVKWIRRHLESFT